LWFSSKHNYDKFFEVFIEFGAVVDVESLKKIKIGKKRRLYSFEFEKEISYD
jgi:hypothetical protein